MFTGIVEHIGTVLEYTPFDDTASGGNGVSLTVSDAAPILNDVHLGDSISINGVCLTVTEFTDSTFKVGISPETLRRTNLEELKPGSKVNLERAVSSHVRFGGHYVQGHVDTVAKIINAEKDENSILFTFQLRDSEFINYIVEKGFIALDGTSLTVVSVDHTRAQFQIMMIQYTQNQVIMPLKKIGDYINVEVDVTGKLLEQQVVANINGQIGNENSPLVKLINNIIEKKLKDFTK
ncbi:hypothetical protein PACTADRAFT_42692 [Pachysolen tannophilus NRRL Y-2460]|uniref:Riboflavin synthase n=1 Tax=Pachysolen tannophilus NRRL Y-2460 TaxID=669874 RepID=A0A1E4TUW4_PACTA|nr:hypothetical protein PACTADRAFT_42692 [Pachysolen tannophilus NRRL Y-2460]